MKYTTYLFILFTSHLLSQGVSTFDMQLLNKLSVEAAFFSPKEFLEREVPFVKDVFVCGCGNLYFMEDKMELKWIVEVDETNAITTKILSGSTTSKIAGKVIDELSGENLLFGNVILYQNEITKGTETDVDGNFEFDNLAPGYYRLEVQYVGYKKIVKFIEVVDVGSLVEVKQSRVVEPLPVLDKFTRIIPEIVILKEFSEGISTISIESIDRYGRLVEDNSARKETVSFFPNPAVDQIELYVQQNTNAISITSISGMTMQRIMNPEAGLKTIHLHDYSNGSYFITINRNGRSRTETLVVLNN